MRESKFNFVPSHQFSNNRDTGHSVRVDFKYGRIIFSIKDIGVSELPGKLVRVYVDISKRAISWKFFQEGEGLESLSNYHKIHKSTHKGKLTSVYISDAMMKRPFIDKGYSPNSSFGKLEVNVYEPQGLLEGKYYYVTIPPKNK